MALCARLVAAAIPPPLPNTSNDQAAALEAHMTAVDGVVAPPVVQGQNTTDVGALDDV